VITHSAVLCVSPKVCLGIVYIIIKRLTPLLAHQRDRFFPK
ncbi:MAG: hypothetical protein ACJA0M_000305, partial [Chitinophagales bacterium]